MEQVTEPLRRFFEGQARVCEAAGSPFSAGILDRLGGSLAAPLAPLLQPWADADIQRIGADAVPMRLLGGLHWLALGGEEPGLAAQYPQQRPQTDWPAAEAALADVARRRGLDLAAFMTSPPQTNEVRRAFALVGGFLTVAVETGLPLRCLEIGASAGLLQNWDRFRYVFGDHGGWGPAGSPALIDGEWRGPPPPLDAALKVALRRGCDVEPVRIAEAAARLRLQAFVWADQADRLARLRSALAVADEAGVALDRADAADWCALHLHPQPGQATVLHHSVMWQYMPAQIQARVREAIETAGRAATPDAPFAWLRMEPPDLVPVMDIRLTLWPGGEERLLGHSHPHGAWVQWLGA